MRFLTTKEELASTYSKGRWVLSGLIFGFLMFLIQGASRIWIDGDDLSWQYGLSILGISLGIGLVFGFLMHVLFGRNKKSSHEL